jgi:hypothetical protein
MMNFKNLPQTLEELSNIVPKTIPILDWSGAINIITIGEEIVFIRRSEEMPTHKGQIGFLGGHRSKGDKSPEENAFRELEEESSIPSEQFEFKGLVPPVSTSRGNSIIPVVSSFNGAREEFIDKMKSNGEWSSFILANYTDLVQSSKWQCAQVLGKKKYDIYFYPLLSSEISTFPDNEKDKKLVLWGASAKMLWNFFKFVCLDVKN